MKKLLIAFWLLPTAAFAGDAYSNGFEHGYNATNPNHFGPSHYGPLIPPVVRPFGQSEFDAGIAEGVRRGREATGEDDNNDE